MGDFVGHFLGGIQHGPGLNKSGKDHISKILASPAKEYIMHNWRKNSHSYTHMNATDSVRTDKNQSHVNITGMTFLDAPDNQPSAIIITMSLVLTGLALISIVLFFVTFWGTIVSKTSRFWQTKVSLGRSNTQNRQSVIDIEDEHTGYCTVAFEETRNSTSGDSQRLSDTGEEHYSHLKRNYGKRTNSDERGSENNYDTVEIKKVYAIGADKYPDKIGFSPDIYVISHFPEVF